MYYIRMKDGRRWKVREAISLKAACNEIANAMVTGSVGSKTTKSDIDFDWRTGRSFAKNEIVVADVVSLNTDYTERRPS